MSNTPSFLDRLRLVFVPTTGQILGSVILSVALLSLAQSSALLRAIGITPVAISVSQAEFQARFGDILRSPIASQLALVTFWATVGLIAYLICWGVYNVLIEARNEITLNTAYINRTDPTAKHWRGPWETLGLKAVAGVGLALIISSLWYGISFWLTLSAGVLSQPSPTTAATTLGAVLGFALHLYLVLAFIQLTFTPWYRRETFTDTVE